MSGQELRRYPQKVRKVDDVDELVFQVPLNVWVSWELHGSFSALFLTADLVTPQPRYRPYGFYSESFSQKLSSPFWCDRCPRTCFLKRKGRLFLQVKTRSLDRGDKPGDLMEIDLCLFPPISGSNWMILLFGDNFLLTWLARSASKPWRERRRNSD